MTIRPFTPLCAMLLLGCEGPSPALSSAQTVRPTDASPQAISSQRRTAITEAVARVAPSVVTVQTEVVQRVAASPMDWFFGGGGPQLQITPGLGSGFLIREGVIVTNAHVVTGAQKINVALRDGATFPATLIGMDEANDLALLRIDAKGLPIATLGTSKGLLIGEWAIAIGNPYGFVLGNTEPSVTAGVISGTGRNLTARTEGNGVYVDMIQTDAAINPGNSGGPLVNALGEVIGVNSSIYSPSGGFVGLGFAIPIDRVKRVTEDLLEHGRVRTPWIGVKVETPQGGVNSVALSSGAKVAQVVPQSPAAAAGIQAGDVLMRSRDRVLRNGYDWEAEQLELRVDETVALVVRRGGREFQTRVTVADRPEVNAQRVSVLKEIELISLTPAIRAERGVRSQRGALVVNVSRQVADNLGLHAGDVIIQVANNEIGYSEITDAQQAKRVLESLSGRGLIRMVLERSGQRVSTDFQIR
ncbi:MAG TPA: trypsin-like peptidase domain-containing protein [Gemmatimonadaceae bacterium]|nr:trypsin-like peptidase domain-containing protein [Gemmatimonadaceae bacterium]